MSTDQRLHKIVTHLEREVAKIVSDASIPADRRAAWRKVLNAAKRAAGIDVGETRGRPKTVDRQRILDANDGHKSIAQIARETGVPASTVADILSGRR